MGISLSGSLPARAWVLPMLFTLVPLAFAAPVYQWKDASGQTVFSDQPPAGVSAEQLTMPAPPSEADAEAARQRTKAIQEQTEQLSEERRQREQRAAEAAKQAAAQQPQVPEDEPGQNSYYDPQNYYPPRQPISRPLPPRGDMPVRPVQPIVRPGRPR